MFSSVLKINSSFIILRFGTLVCVVSVAFKSSKSICYEILGSLTIIPREKLEIKIINRSKTQQFLLHDNILKECIISVKIIIGIVCQSTFLQVRVKSRIVVRLTNYKRENLTCSFVQRKSENKKKKTIFHPEIQVVREFRIIKKKIHQIV